MTSGQERALALLEAQQKNVKARGPQWMAAEQLKDICRREPASAELIGQDLERSGMSITDAEKKIKAFADAHKTGNFACVTPIEAEDILREMYGLQTAPKESKQLAGPGAGSGFGALDLADFL